MNCMKTYDYCCSIIGVAQTLETEPTKEVPVHITTGASWRTLPETITYESSIPLSFAMPWNNMKGWNQIKNNLTEVYCHKESRTGACLVMNRAARLHRLLETNMEQFMSSWNTDNFNYYSLPSDEDSVHISLTGNRKNYFQNKTLDDNFSEVKRKRAIEFIGDALSYCCGIVTTKSFDSLSTESNTLKKQLNAMNMGFQKALRYATESSDAFTKYSNDITLNFQQVQTHIKEYERYVTDKINANNMREREEANNVLMTLNLVYQNLVKIVGVTSVMRDMDILNHCKQKMIPIIIVPPEILLRELLRLKMELELSSHTLAVPLSNIAKYYHLPICDCTISEEKINVQIRIPIVGKNNNWELLELIATPLKWGEQTCTILFETMYLAISHDRNGKGISMRPITGANLHQCRPFHDKLCYLPRYSAGEIYVCATKMYRGSTVQSLSRHCPFRCQQSNSLSISEVNEDVFVITHPPKETNIRCNGYKSYLEESAYEQPGAIQISLPCNCSLFGGDEILIPNRYPCGNQKITEIEAVHLLPAMWSNLKSFVLSPLHINNPVKFSNMQECLNKNWTLDIAHLNVTSNKELNNLAKTMDDVNQLSSTYQVNYGKSSDQLFLIWNILLSVGILYLLYRAQPIALIPLLNRANAEDKDTTNESLTYLAIVCGITSTILLLIAYTILLVLYIRRRNKKLKENMLDFEFQSIDTLDTKMIPEEEGEDEDKEEETDMDLEEYNGKQKEMPGEHQGVPKASMRRLQHEKQTTCDSPNTFGVSTQTMVGITENLEGSIQLANGKKIPLFIRETTMRRD